MTEFIKEWALKAWELDRTLIGDLSGGIDPVKQMISCTVVDQHNVVILYDLPETCGLSDVRYHVVDPCKVRTDRFEFKEDGTIIMNGDPFPCPALDSFGSNISRLQSDFRRDYARAFKDINNKEV